MTFPWSAMINMKTTYFDIETGPLSDEELTAIIPPFNADDVKLGNVKDPEKIKAKLEAAETNYFADARDKAALSATTGKVLAIGLEDRDGTRCLAAANEAEILEDFWHGFRSDHSRYIGFNIFGFDLPFMIRRSWKLGVAVPGVRQGRYWNERFVDLREMWQLGDRQAKGSLDAICAHFGLAGKNGNGKDFARLFELNPAQALKYLCNDLRMTREVHEMMAGGVA